MTHGRPSSDFDGDALRVRREHGGLSLRALAEQCKQAGKAISDSQLSKIERGMCRPRPATMRALAVVFEVEVRDLLRQPQVGAA